MANRISNRFDLNRGSSAGFSNPPQRAIIPTPIVYTPITTAFAQPAPSGSVLSFNGVTTALGREK